MKATKHLPPSVTPQATQTAPQACRMAKPPLPPPAAVQPSATSAAAAPPLSCTCTPISRGNALLAAVGAKEKTVAAAIQHSQKKVTSQSLHENVFHCQTVSCPLLQAAAAAALPS